MNRSTSNGPPIVIRIEIFADQRGNGGNEWKWYIGPVRHRSVFIQTTEQDEGQVNIERYTSPLNGIEVIRNKRRCLLIVAVGEWEKEILEYRHFLQFAGGNEQFDYLITNTYQETASWWENLPADSSVASAAMGNRLRFLARSLQAVMPRSPTLPSSILVWKHQEHSWWHIFEGGGGHRDKECFKA